MEEFGKDYEAYMRTDQASRARRVVRRTELPIAGEWASAAQNARPVKGGLRTYTLTIAVVSGTALITGASLLYPGILLALQRSPAALGAGQVWRFITPLFVERGGWKEIAFNLVSLIAVGVLAERLWGKRRWVIFYLTGGVTGQACGLAWRPIGAGSSVAVCGLLGACAFWALPRRTSWLAVLAGMLTIVMGVVLTVMHNLHGPPLLVGALAAGLATRDPEQHPDHAARRTTT